MKKALFLAPFVPVLLTLAAAIGAVGVIEAGFGTPVPPAVMGSAAPGLPIAGPLLHLYAEAASSCPGLPWSLLAAIGTVESDNGASLAPGVHSGANSAGAEGPMQFEPATFAAYSEPVPAGGAVPPSPYDPTDAVFAAARMLCSDGGESPAMVAQAVWDYNHSLQYVEAVLAAAQSYGYTPGQTGVAGATAVGFALSQLGTPYVWGGEEPGVAFDCSGLAQAAWAVAGRSLPRVAQAQFDAGPKVEAGAALQAGDLVFFGSGRQGVDHVGIVVDGEGVMVDAPHTGSVVRVEEFPVRVGAKWGDETYLGATDPGRRGTSD